MILGDFNIRLNTTNQDISTFLIWDISLSISKHDRWHICNEILVLFFAWWRINLINFFTEATLVEELQLYNLTHSLEDKVDQNISKGINTNGVRTHLFWCHIPKL